MRPRQLFKPRRTHMDHRTQVMCQPPGTQTTDGKPDSLLLRLLLTGIVTRAAADCINATGSLSIVFMVASCLLHDQRVLPWLLLNPGFQIRDHCRTLPALAHPMLASLP